MERTNIGSGTHWEAIVGYSRAVRVGAHIYVAGTTAVDDAGQTVGTGDPYTQTRHILQKIEAALKAVGGSLSDVVRTRTFVVNIADWQEIGRAHGEFFADIRPAATMVEVRALVAPDLLVEIEADAIVREQPHLTPLKES